MKDVHNFIKEYRELLKKYNATLNVESHINFVENKPESYVWFDIGGIFVNIFEGLQHGNSDCFSHIDVD